MIRSSVAKHKMFAAKYWKSCNNLHKRLKIKMTHLMVQLSSVINNINIKKSNIFVMLTHLKITLALFNFSSSVEKIHSA